MYGLDTGPGSKLWLTRFTSCTIRIAETVELTTSLRSCLRAIMRSTDLGLGIQYWSETSKVKRRCFTLHLPLHQLLVRAQKYNTFITSTTNTTIVGIRQACIDTAAVINYIQLIAESIPCVSHVYMYFLKASRIYTVLCGTLQAYIVLGLRQVQST